MRLYELKRIGQLLFTKGAIKGPNSTATFAALVDTDSTYTILPWEHLTTSGFEPLAAEGTVRLLTGSGHIIAPKFKVEWISCFGLRLDSFLIVAHTLPSDLSGFGLLGIDLLRQVKAHIDVFNAQVKVAE